MRLFTRWLCAITLMSWVPGLAVGADLGQEIDLTSFGAAEPAWFEGPAADRLPLEDVAFGRDVAARRLYVSGIVGASFASLTTAGGPNADPSWNQSVTLHGTVNDTLFTGGGAIGIAWARPGGDLRMEFEGRGRDLQNGVAALDFNAPVPMIANSIRAADGWTTMANVWRDWFLTDRIAVYCGGGVGGGGYRLSSFAAFDVVGTSVYGSSPVAGFAWQAGGGVFYELSERVAIDLGYRFSAIDAQHMSLIGAGRLVPGGSMPYGTLTTGYSASEVLLSVRIYEPFRRWR